MKNKKLESDVEEKEVKLHLRNAMQKAYDIIFGELSGVDFLCLVQNLENSAKEKGIELKLNPEAMQKTYETLLSSKGGYLRLKEFESYARKKGVELQYKSGLVNKRQEEAFIEGEQNEVEWLECYMTCKDMGINDS